MFLELQQASISDLLSDSKMTLLQLRLLAKIIASLRAKPSAMMGEWAKVLLAASDMRLLFSSLPVVPEEAIGASLFQAASTLNFVIPFDGFLQRVWALIGWLLGAGMWGSCFSKREP